MSSCEDDKQTTVQHKIKKNGVISSDSEDSVVEIFPPKKKNEIIVISDDESIKDSGLSDFCTNGITASSEEKNEEPIVQNKWSTWRKENFFFSDSDVEISPANKKKKVDLKDKTRSLGQINGHGNRAVVTRQSHEALPTNTASHSRLERPTTECRHVLDPDQPTTSSKNFEFVSDNNRSRSPQPSTSRGSSVAGTSRRRRQSPPIVGQMTKKSSEKAACSSSTTKRKRFVMTEIDEDGNEVETVTCIKITRKILKNKESTEKTSGKKLQCRNIDRAVSETVKGRLGKTLGICTRGVSAAVPTLKNIVSTVTSEQLFLVNARYRAGISQFSLFGHNPGLHYSPPGG